MSVLGESELSGAYFKNTQNIKENKKCFADYTAGSNREKNLGTNFSSVF